MKASKRKRIKRLKHNPIIGYHLVDYTYRVIAPPGDERMNPCFGSKKKAMDAAERYGQEEQVIDVVALRLAGMLSVIFHDVGDIQMDGQSAKQMMAACQRNDIELDQKLKEKVKAEEKDAIYSSRQLLKA